MKKIRKTNDSKSKIPSSDQVQQPVNDSHRLRIISLLGDILARTWLAEQYKNAHSSKTEGNDNVVAEST